MLGGGDIVGRYEIVGVLARGGMGVVYTARQPKLGSRLVALKQVALRERPDLVEAFVQEARTVARLDHPNVVQVHDLFEHEGVPYIAMEYVKGGSLRAWMQAATLAQVLGALEGMLAGLAHAHAHDVVHCDIKPENILVSAGGGVKLADFGLARALEHAGEGHTGGGTPGYMAPEQADGGVVGPRTDLYAVGLVAYELLLRRRPFDDGREQAAPREDDPSLDRSIAAWLEALLAAEPESRPRSALEAWERLEDTALRLLGGLWRRHAPLVERRGPAPAPASDGRPRLARGTVVRDTYTVGSLLGAGAFGDVYRVEHRFLGTQALKLIGTGSAELDLEELLDEARVLATLHDRHVIRLFDAGTFEYEGARLPFLTTEYVAHGTLEEQRAQNVRATVPLALECARQILLGLAAAHALEPTVLHRDVTPRNVLIASLEPLVLKLSDFGLAAHVEPVSRVSRAAGTFRYQPPEAALGYATESSDLYAVGLILYELLTGMPAFPLGDAADLGTVAGVTRALTLSRRTRPRPPSAFRSGIPRAVDELVVSALEPRPEDRFRSARAFANTIALVLDAL